MASWNQDPSADAPGALGKVLLVDDEPELRRVVRRHLIKAGFEVLEAPNGRVALELALQGELDVVVSDVRMPDMGGLELVERLSEQAPELPVVLVSGCSGFADAGTALAYGVVGCLAKPVDLDQLIASVSFAVGIRRGLLKRVDVPRDSETRLAVASTDRLGSRRLGSGA